MTALVAETSLEQDTLVWPPPGHAVSDNPALQKLLKAQHDKVRKDQEQAATERMQTGPAAQSTTEAPANNTVTSAFLATREALKERRSADLPIRSPKDLSDLRVRFTFTADLVSGRDRHTQATYFLTDDF